ncbi:aldehyde dehydrogenase family protein [Labrys monachus]|uniref:Acyl-CoA reductase-like NAD-dependent aldehyde dehydrogenase n=1 Tax=Labrys monachus TaxID=217067 RepID=A0ABU0F8R0_9HYPH|nr:aldehyde dehydrogenase family protein [Labrys monachus]MDQ0390998.1 acyl-CoA reductase-like NAD-dependent aldehyde dehydrogenase [Labrys monachus]
MDQSNALHTLPAQPRDFGFFIDGRWEEAGPRAIFERTSPAHDRVVTRITRCTREDVDRAVGVARAAFEDGRWSRLSGAERAAVLLRAAAGIRGRLHELALLETLETGKPIGQSLGEVEGGAGIYEYAAGAARALHGDAFNNLGDRMFGLVTREPIGVVGLITPWNFPFFILSERVPFILAAGCTIVAKPSEVTSATTLLMAEILAEAGLPDGVFNVVTGSGAEIGQALTEHPDIDMVSFTGSTAVGRKALLASAGNFKKLGLELGGKNPQIVFADANLEDAADGVVFGLCFNAGQCCVSGSRLVVEKSVAAQFEALVADRIARLRIGDPLDPRTQMGAIVTEAQNRTILGYIEAGGREGARLVCGGGALASETGRYIRPTVFGDVTRDMTIFREEIFGPVLTISTFETLDEAIEIANDTVYGLAASIWTTNLETSTQAFRRVRAGRVWVNTTIAGGPELPIGGFKQSGTGRETGIYGVEEYTQVKTVHIALGRREPWVA